MSSVDASPVATSSKISSRQPSGGRTSSGVATPQSQSPTSSPPPSPPSSPTVRKRHPRKNDSFETMTSRPSRGTMIAKSTSLAFRASFAPKSKSTSHVLTKVSLVVFLPSAAFILSMLALTTLPLALVIFLSLYIGLLMAVAFHASASTIARRIKKYTASPAPDTLQASADASKAASPSVPNLDDVWTPGEKNLLALRVTNLDPTTEISRTVASSPSATSEAKPSDTQKPHGSPFNPDLSVAPRFFQKLIHSLQGYSSQLSESRKVIFDRLTKVVVIAFLAVPVIVHAAAALATTALIDASISTAKVLRQNIPRLISALRLLLARIVAKAQEFIETYGPHIYLALESAFFKLIHVTRRIYAMTTQAAQFALLQVTLAMTRLGALIHDSWDPIIVPAFLALQQKITAVFVWTRGFLLSIVPTLRRWANDAYIIVGNGIVKLITFTQHVLTLLQPTLARLHDLTLRFIVIVKDTAHRLAVLGWRACVKLHEICMALGMQKLLDALPVVAKRVWDGYVSFIAVTGKALHQALETTFEYLLKFDVFSRAVKIAKHLIAEAKRLYVIGLGLAVAVLASSKRLATPVVETIVRVSGPAWEKTVLFATQTAAFIVERTSKADIRGKLNAAIVVMHIGLERAWVNATIALVWTRSKIEKVQLQVFVSVYEDARLLVQRAFAVAAPLFEMILAASWSAVDRLHKVDIRATVQQVQAWPGWNQMRESVQQIYGFLYLLQEFLRKDGPKLVEWAIAVVQKVVEAVLEAFRSQQGKAASPPSGATVSTIG
ncbi:hypothetical protein DFJ73DRAFT_813748 [Zopfochytrium polystomum]|nr:hypothetical protein DFJ73DRAFT_813748 [Zopfochytrium polystomum]